MLGVVVEVTPRDWSKQYGDEGYSVSRSLWLTTSGEYLLVVAMKWPSERIRGTKVMRAGEDGGPLSLVPVCYVEEELNPRKVLRYIGYEV